MLYSLPSLTRFGSGQALDHRKCILRVRARLAATKGLRRRSRCVQFRNSESHAIRKESILFAIQQAMHR
jgi:hypothetical protein